MSNLGHLYRFIRDVQLPGNAHQPYFIEGALQRHRVTTFKIPAVEVFSLVWFLVLLWASGHICSLVVMGCNVDDFRGIIHSKYAHNVMATNPGPGH